MSHQGASMRLLLSSGTAAAPVAVGSPLDRPLPPGASALPDVPAAMFGPGALRVVTPSPTWQELERDMASVRTDTHAAGPDQGGPTIADAAVGSQRGTPTAHVATEP